MDGFWIASGLLTVMVAGLIERHLAKRGRDEKR